MKKEENENYSITYRKDYADLYDKNREEYYSIRLDYLLEISFDSIIEFYERMYN